MPTRKMRGLRRHTHNAFSISKKRGFTSTSHSRQSAVAAVGLEPQISKDEYYELINTYPDLQPPSRSSTQGKQGGRHLPLAPRLVLTPEQEIEPSRTILPPENEEHRQQIRHFQLHLRKKLGRTSHSKIWETYENMPSPRTRYLKDATINRLFRHLAWVEFKNSEDAMQRYFKLLNECVNEGVPMSSSIWNTAISFSGRWLRGVTSREVKSAVETWMQMEDVGVQATHVTFNILFDVAVRADRFALADMIFDELKLRDMPLNRYFRTGLIYYAGRRRDGDGVRQAFRDMVAAGEIVDTAVMNCVILSLVQAGEAAAAENVFLKMKVLHEQKFSTIGPGTWQGQRELGALLDKTAIQLRKERQQHLATFFGSAVSTDDRRESVQKASPIAPNAVTYRILIRYHTYTSADIDRIRQLIDEMQERGFHVHGSVYVHLFRGFSAHGGYAFSPWSLNGLEDLWDDFVSASTATSPSRAATRDHIHDLQSVADVKSDTMIDAPPTTTALDDADDEVISETERLPYYTPQLAIAIVEAFYKCAGRRRMRAVWNEIQDRWKTMNVEDRLHVQETVDACAKRDSVYIV